ncbi:MAG: TetR/AcrR family transcriptional regulator [Propioniciclava sp.]
MARSRTYPDDLRDRLVAAATERLRHHPPDEMSLRDLAASVDTSTNAIYSMFGGKDELIGEVMARAKWIFISRQWEFANAGPSIEALTAMGTYYRTWALENPALYRLMYSGNFDPNLSFSITDESLDPLRTMLQRCMDAGLLLNDDAEALAMSAWASLHGFVSLEMTVWTDEGSRRRAVGVFGMHMRRFLEGLIVEPAH